MIDMTLHCIRSEVKLFMYVLKVVILIANRNHALRTLSHIVQLVGHTTFFFFHSCLPIRIKKCSQGFNSFYSICVCQDGIRRGRPRADTVRELISEGETSSSRIRCNICNRVFPREKSLQAHKRTHTGERGNNEQKCTIMTNRFP